MAQQTLDLVNHKKINPSICTKTVDGHFKRFQKLLVQPVLLKKNAKSNVLGDPGGGRLPDVTGARRAISAYRGWSKPCTAPITDPPITSKNHPQISSTQPPVVSDEEKSRNGDTLGPVELIG